MGMLYCDTREVESVGSVIPAEQLPRCQKCGGIPVEYLWVEFRDSNVEFTAECHGEIETVVVPSEYLEDIEYALTQVEFGPAFTS